MRFDGGGDSVCEFVPLVSMVIVVVVVGRSVVLLVWLGGG